MRAMPLWIDDGSQQWDAIEARIVEWKYKHDIQLACIDYIQIISHPGKRFDALSDISRRTKLLLALSLVVLVASTVIVGYGNYLGAGRAA
jgi:replicative DNA helicase